MTGKVEYDLAQKITSFLHFIVCTSFLAEYGIMGSISSTFYEQLLRSQIPKAQKRLSSQLAFFALLGSASVKAACRMLVKLTPVRLPSQIICEAG